jgi:hypothetical protein
MQVEGYQPISKLVREYGQWICPVQKHLGWQGIGQQHKHLKKSEKAIKSEKEKNVG